MAGYTVGCTARLEGGVCQQTQVVCCCDGMHTISLAGLSPGAETELLVDNNELIEDFNSYTSLVVAHAAGPRCWWMLYNRELVDSLNGSSSSLATGPRRAKDVMPSALRQAMPSSHFLCQCPAMITLET
jgi:hypothetical protein